MVRLNRAEERDLVESTRRKLNSLRYNLRKKPPRKPRGVWMEAWGRDRKLVYLAV
jgi:hypothetical protein